MKRIPKKGDKVVLINDDYYSELKKGTKGEVLCSSSWHWRADILLSDGDKKNVHFDNIELIDKYK